MARTDNLSNFLTDVASAIKTKKGSNTAIPAANFDTEISNLPSQGTYQTKSITINSNGNTSVTPDQGYDAIDQLNITTAVSTPDSEYDTNLELSEDVLSTSIDGIYDRLEYIKSTGTQYIDLGFIPTVTTEYDFTFYKETSGGYNTYEQAFGVRQSGGSYWANCVGLFYYIYNAQKISYYNNRGEQNQYSFNMYDTKVRFVSRGEFATLTNLSTDTTQTIQSTEKTDCKYSLYLFGCRTIQNNYTSVLHDPTKNFRLYEFKVYDNNRLVRYLIPVRRKSDNIVGLYDVITNYFYTNDGTGSFTAGPVKS